MRDRKTHDSVKPIETQYKGYRFRSRLEARWAVCFDAMNIAWDYEHEGFETLNGRYLPDFFLPALNVWVEVKPIGADERHPDAIKWAYVAKATNKSIIVLDGAPDSLASYTIIYKCGTAMAIDGFVSEYAERFAKSARFDGWDEAPCPVPQHDLVEFQAMTHSKFMRDITETINHLAIKTPAIISIAFILASQALLLPHIKKGQPKPALF